METNNAIIPNKTDKKAKMMVGVILCVTLLLVVVGLSYAMLPTDNLRNEPLDVTASTGTLKLRYTDCDNADVSTCADIAKDLAPGESVTKEFKITNVGTAPSKYTIYFRELSNTFKHDELVYTLENLTSGEMVVENAPVPESADSELSLKDHIESPVGSTVRYRLTITFLNTARDQSDNMEAEFSMRIGIKDANFASGDSSVSADSILQHLTGSKTVNTTSPTFDSPATTDEGIFEMEDDYGTSYYYRGAVTNNYVKFAGFYWRIIRINGDGSLRIIYDGTTPHANGEASDDRFTHINQVFNTLYDDAKYVGWMHGPANETSGVTTSSTSKEEAQSNIESSDIKKVVDEWYYNNIEKLGYGGAVADVLFCNDRSTPGKAVTTYSSDTGLGFAKNPTAYGATARTGVWNSSTTPSAPTFKCAQKNDSFTVEDTTKGNGALDYPVGLITADEIVAAGSGKFNKSNSSYYLYRPSNWCWSLSPCGMYPGGYGGVFRVNASGQLGDFSVDSSGAIAPVINLSATYADTLIGTGIMTDPYRASGETA